MAVVIPDSGLFFSTGYHSTTHHLPHFFACPFNRLIVKFFINYMLFHLGAMMAELGSVQKKIILFRNERDWAQFHDPKNLAEALSIEAGELLENFLRKTTAQSRTLTAEERNNANETIAVNLNVATSL